MLTPTRELALQISDSFKAYGHYLRLRTAVIFGGVSQNPQVDELRRGVDILVATPGRLNDLIGQGYIDLSRVETLVLDEADRMLDMGFIHDVREDHRPGAAEAADPLFLRDDAREHHAPGATASSPTRSRWRWIPSPPPSR